MKTFGEYIVFSGRTPNSQINNRLFVYNVRKDTVDILPYGAKTITTNQARLYIGSPQDDNVYEILTGFDDENEVIENYWLSNDERFGVETLKKVKRLRMKGLISPEQILEVSVSYDGGGYELVGTVRGDGGYVDKVATVLVGSHGIGIAEVGGGSDDVEGSFYFTELKLRTPKFRKRTIKLEAKGVGFVSVNMFDDFDVRLFNKKLPTKYRLKQNVSLDGTLVNQ
jgi:hypothetical protein